MSSVATLRVVPTAPETTYPVALTEPVLRIDPSTDSTVVTLPTPAWTQWDSPSWANLTSLVGEDTHELQWQDRALCAQTDPEAFFPEKGGSTREAKRVCMGCEVRAECLEYALARDERFGIWGGLSERERRRLRKAM